MSAEDLFSKFGLEVADANNLQLKTTYPLFGSITSFEEESPEKIEIGLNGYIKLTLNVKKEEDRKMLKERAFEPGIFITTISKVDEEGENFTVFGDCSSVVFGKRQFEYEQ